jgi:hypothetical protein
MHLSILFVSVALGASGVSVARAQAAAAADSLALIGTWQLDLGRTHYGAGVDQRRREKMVCVARGGSLRCTVESVRADGRSAVARFAAPVAGGRSTVVGLPDIDTVDLQPLADGLVDATFFYRRQAKYGYRAYRSADSNTLFIVSVDPVTRAALTSIIVYARVRTAVSLTETIGVLPPHAATKTVVNADPFSITGKSKTGRSPETM